MKYRRTNLTAVLLTLSLLISGLLARAEDFYPKSFLILDHLFVFKNPTVNYRISVKGKIEVSSKMEGLVQVQNRGPGESLTPVFSLSGKGPFKVTGRGNMALGEFRVEKINYDSTMTATITGKTRYVNPANRQGVWEFANLALEKTWNGDLTWDIQTSEPENDKLRLDMLKRVVPTKIPDSPHSGRTLQFYCGPIPASDTYEKVDSVPGMGTFRWRYTSTG